MRFFYNHKCIIVRFCGWGYVCVCVCVCLCVCLYVCVVCVGVGGWLAWGKLQNLSFFIEVVNA